ncbi:Uncharacterised protein [Mycobacteroides abscessus subsp. abscessus]|nr:Uncharacterised protein [Mycobacteroides abscessus subsp. abscessus]
MDRTSRREVGVGHGVPAPASCARPLTRIAVTDPVGPQAPHAYTGTRRRGTEHLAARRLLRLSGDVLLDRLVAGILLRACGIGVSRIEVSGRLVALLGRRSTVGSVRVGLWFFRRARGVVACRQRVVELLLGHARLVEGVASTTVWQSEFDADAHILLGHRRCAAQRRMCGRGACDDDVAAQSVDVEVRADACDASQFSRADLDTSHGCASGGDPVGECSFVVGIQFDEAIGIGVEVHPASNDLDAVVDLARRGDVDGQPETVEQLRT